MQNETTNGINLFALHSTVEIIICIFSSYFYKHLCKNN